MNADAALCTDFVNSFQNLGHLLECKNRHFFKPVTSSIASSFTKPKECLVEILYVFSPARFSVRILKYKDVKSMDWKEFNSVDSFKKFTNDFKEFYAKNFTPVQNVSDIHIDGLYVLKHDNGFSRCRIIAKK